MDDITATVRSIKRLQKDYMDNMLTVLQDELRMACKELKKSASTATDKAVRVTQPAAMLPELADPAAGRYVARASLLITVSAACATRRDISLHPALSRLKCLCLCNSKRASQLPLPIDVYYCRSLAQEMTEEDGLMFLN